MLKNSQSVRNYFLELQNRITEKLQEEESVSFVEDQWNRDEGGGGQSRILENGELFEKAGINFSDVQGKHLPASATDKRPNLENASFRAMGISLVFHPRNPFVPTCHMNLRHFSVFKDDEKSLGGLAVATTSLPITGLRKMQSTGTAPHMMPVNLSAKIFIPNLKKRVIVISTYLIGKSLVASAVSFLMITTKSISSIHLH
jgi:hypothetical protein